MVYYAPLIFIISTWIAITNKSWRPFCVSLACASFCNVVFAILRDIYSYDWSVVVEYYIVQDFCLLVLLWASVKYFKPIEYSEARNLAEPFIMFIYLIMLFYNSIYWVSHTFPLGNSYSLIVIANIIHYQYGTTFDTLNTLILLSLLLGGGFYVWVWGRSKLVYRKLPDNIRTSVSTWRRRWSLSKREEVQ